MIDPSRRRSTPSGVRVEAAHSSPLLTIDGETVSRFSHQLRSLLTSVGAAADYLLRNEIEPGVQNEMLSIISEQATRIDGLLDDFLVIADSRPRGAASPAAVDLYQVTREVVRDLAGEAQSGGVWLVLDTGGAIPPVLGHHRPLRQAVTAALRAMLTPARSGDRIVARLTETRSAQGERLVEFCVTVQSDDPTLDSRAGSVSPNDIAVQAACRISEQHGGTFEPLDDRPGLVCRLPAASLEVCPTVALRPPAQIEASGS